jgi:hypothetical protein
MSTPLPERDWIALNAYLDGELSPDERAALESRLAAEPALREELTALRDTIAVVGMAQRQRVPRNFTLDPATYGRPARRSLLDRLGLSGFPLAAAASTAIAVIAIGGGVILATGLARSGGANVAMEAAPMAQEAPAEAGEMITSDDMQADTAMPEAFSAEALPSPPVEAADEVEAPAEGEMAADEQAAEAEVDAAAAMAEGEAAEEEAIPEEEAAPAAAEPAEEAAAEAPEAELAVPAEEPATGIGGGMGGAPSTEMAPTEVAERSAAPGEENAAAEAITKEAEPLMEQQVTEAPAATIPATAEAAAEPTTTQSARSARTSITIGAGLLALALLLGIGLLISLRRNPPRG